VAKIQGIDIDDNYLASAKTLGEAYKKSLVNSKVIDAP
jgi:hypothetical protein